MKPSEQLKTIAAKVPDSLARKLDKAAKAGGRTRSSELRLRLERSLKEMATVAGVAS